MARQWCEKCNKAQSMCICHMITLIDNKYKLIILQHPSEANKAIGTARILSLSLTRCDLYCQEQLPVSLLENRPSFLLYPAAGEEVPVKIANYHFPADSQFILLDGSWKKAFRLLQLNPALQALPKVALSHVKPTQYTIRKSNKDDGVSSVEAGFYLMSELEQQSIKFQPLLDAFQGMVKNQLSCMPSSVRRQHYGYD
ncbi:tRNA-uridine aminocarboxypropyltransferase [Motilimonas pumila]|uniref:tRNA-uridine aminocarboxypropyltransferase n=1 Tax=Motilimonas pumila TaxID=2303987 RepID=A0A418YG94_9GAMM|nr:tRNA-uridine aminocarboxypropyltransferase [Motilimonas pumila]RJG48664.1 DTW domain-containing protein [Motilimonas pumila]